MYYVLDLFAVGGVQKSSHVRTEGTSLVMEVRFIDCCCTFCRENKEGECPYIAQFGEWREVTLRLKGKLGAAALKRKKYNLRKPDFIRCCGCKRTGGDQRTDFFCLCDYTCWSATQPKPTHIGHEKIPKMRANGPAPKAKNPGNVMMLCDDCDEAWHLKCLRPFALKKAVPLTYYWYCPNCVDPCVTCSQVDMYDDPKQRLLRCFECSKSVHMHCLPEPLNHEPRGRWKCNDCASLRVVTRLVAEHKCCAFCHAHLRKGEPGTCECSRCSRLWHSKFPCLKSHQRPDDEDAPVYEEDGWLCPECD